LEPIDGNTPRTIWVYNMKRVTTYLVSNRESIISKEFIRLTSLNNIPHKYYEDIPAVNTHEVQARVQQVNFTNSLAICDISERVNRINIFTDVNRAIRHTINLGRDAEEFEKVEDS